MHSLHPFEDYNEPGNFLKTQNMNKTQVKKVLDEICLSYKTYLLNNLCMPGTMPMIRKKNETYSLSSGLVEFGVGDEE